MLRSATQSSTSRHSSACSRARPMPSRRCGSKWIRSDSTARRQGFRERADRTRRQALLPETHTMMRSGEMGETNRSIVVKIVHCVKVVVSNVNTTWIAIFLWGPVDDASNALWRPRDYALDGQVSQLHVFSRTAVGRITVERVVE